MGKNFITEYFIFSRKDRIAVLIIVLIILSIFLIPTIVSKSKLINKNEGQDTTWISSLKKLETKETENPQYRQFEDDNNNFQYDRRTNSYTGKNKGELFYFDPNTLPSEGWIKLGLRGKTIHTIQNYLSKGGKFRKPEDLQRIYGLFPNEYERIAPYIIIESTGETNNNKNFTDKHPTEAPPVKTYTPRYAIVDINEADTAALIALPGIGSKLASRIINFRDKLGGFYTLAQVGETFGLPDSTFQKIKQYLKLENTTIKKININSATVDELKAHPYIRYTLANPIIAYRKEHGPFLKVEDLKKVIVVTDEIYNKFFHYLSVQ
ncbi:MAG: helix-hairpin-helix domain-containing protein [Chitinophagaceae bacterium]